MVQPLIVEENIIIEILVSKTSDKLERELGELSQVVSCKFPLSRGSGLCLV